MAVKSQDQITIVDLTDGYSVELSLSALTLNAGTSTLGTQKQITIDVQAFQGSTQIIPAVTQTDIVCPSNVSASVGTVTSYSLPITFTFAAALNADGVISIPVQLDSGAVTIVKTLAFSLAFKGSQGSKGDTGAPGKDGATGATGSPGKNGEDAYMMTITTNNGTVFKNSTGSTTLTAHLYKGGSEITIPANGVITGVGNVVWYKDGTTAGTANHIDVSAGNINSKAVYEVRLEEA